MIEREPGRHLVVVGGGTAGSVLASRLSEDPTVLATLLEVGPDHDAYDSAVLDPARAAAAWTGAAPIVTTPVLTETGGPISVLHGRLLGGTSAVNGLATLRGQPADYDGWAAAGLDGWGREGASIRGLADAHSVHRRKVCQTIEYAVPPPRKTPHRGATTSERIDCITAYRAPGIESMFRLARTRSGRVSLKTGER